MKELFKKYGARLNETERQQIWRNIANAPNPAPRRSPRLAPAFAASVVGAAAVLLVFFTLRHGGPLEQPIARSDMPAVAEIGTKGTEPEKGSAALDMEESAASAAVQDVFADVAEDVAAEPTAPGGPATVASPEMAQRSTAATDQPHTDRATRSDALAKRARPDDNTLSPKRSKSEAIVAEELQNMALAQESLTRAQDSTAPAQDSLAPAQGSPTPVSAAEAKSTAVSARADRARGTIVAKVRDAETGEILPFAEVLVTGLPDSLQAIFGGSFRLEDLEPGRDYHFEVFHLGYAPERRTVTLAPGKTSELDIPLRTVIVQTLAALDVEAEYFLGDIAKARSAQRIDSDQYSKYALDSVEEALNKQTGVVMRSGQLYERGGRSGEVSTQIDEVPQDAATPQGSSQDATRWGGVLPLSKESRARARLESAQDERRTGPERPGYWRRLHPQPWIWVPPNDEAFDTMFFQHYGTNPFIITEEDNLSTFALDVDNASYTVSRRYLREGHLPPRDAVRVEEYVNYFGQDYGPVGDDDFRIYADGAPSPFGEGYHLIRIGVKARQVRPSRRVPANLVFVIDVSGSMKRQNRLELVKRALHVLLDELDEGDRVGIVIYGTRGQVVLEPTGVEQRRRIENAIDALTPGGSTNAEEGLYLAYRMARRHFEQGTIHRLILCSDGVANQGRTGAEEILAHVRRQSDDGIQLSTIGFGMGNYNDVLLEKLADQGDGNYYYVDELREAERVFRENLTGTLQTVGRDVKVQVEFDPERVSRYRLIGYENRDVADRDFRNDAVDAGEVGAGHQVTALYEVKLSGVTERERRSGSDRRRQQQLLGTVRLRYEVPDHAPRRAGEVQEISHPILMQDLSRSFGRAEPRLQLAAVVAEFAEILRGSYWARDGQLSALVPMAAQLYDELRDDKNVCEFAWLVRRAASLQDGDHGREDRQDREDWEVRED